MGTAASTLGNRVLAAAAEADGDERRRRVRAALAMLQQRTGAVLRISQQYYALVDAHAIAPARRGVEEQVVRRVRRWIEEAEVTSKLLFVKSISTTSIAEAFEIALNDVRWLHISKRQYEVYNCGPELLNVPTLHAVSHHLELADLEVIAFLLDKCRWTPWLPPTSFRMKTDQVYDVVVHVAVRDQGFLTGEVRTIQLRVGRKWVGPHHHDAMDFAKKSTWLHRTDYETTENVRIAESAFFHAVDAAWRDYLAELAKVPKEDLRSGEEAGNGFPYDAQERHTSLRVKYLIDTSLDRILKEHRTIFRSAHLFEQWRMEQEDSPQHQVSTELSFAGALAQEQVHVLEEYYEEQAMRAEDWNVYA